MKIQITVFNVCIGFFLALFTVEKTAAFSNPQQIMTMRTPAVVVSRKHNNNNILQKMSENNDDGEGELSETNQGILGGVGSILSVVTLYSEYILQTTGAGLPAGPAGLVGLAEGLGYLSVVGIGGYSAYTKVKSGSGLPAGPFGLLGAAEGLSFLAVVVGIVVFALQALN